MKKALIFLTAAAAIGTGYILAKKYIEKVEELTGVPVVIFSVGPDTKQTIIRKELY